MIPIILICQILIQAIFHYKDSVEALIVLHIALAFCSAMAEARWCAIWARYDDLEMRLKRLGKHLYNMRVNSKRKDRQVLKTEITVREDLNRRR